MASLTDAFPQFSMLPPELRDQIVSFLLLFMIPSVLTFLNSLEYLYDLPLVINRAANNRILFIVVGICFPRGSDLRSARFALFQSITSWAKCQIDVC